MVLIQTQLNKDYDLFVSKSVNIFALKQKRHVQDPTLLPISQGGYGLRLASVVFP